MAVNLNPKPTEPTPGLGFVHMPQPEDDNYPMAAALAEPAADVLLPWFKHHSTFYPLLNQKRTSQCVLYGGGGVLMTSPVRHRRDQFTPEFLAERYRYAQNHDEYPGDESTGLFGTSINAGCKAYREVGLVKEWYHARTMDELIRWLLLDRPLIVGVNWYQSFYDLGTTATMEIRPGSHIVGGHAIEVSGYNRRDGRFRLPNTWGIDGWQGSDYGRGWCPGELLERLLFHEGGDAVGIVEADPT